MGNPTTREHVLPLQQALLKASEEAFPRRSLMDVSSEAWAELHVRTSFPDAVPVPFYDLVDARVTASFMAGNEGKERTSTERETHEEGFLKHAKSIGEVVGRDVVYAGVIEAVGLTPDEITDLLAHDFNDSHRIKHNGLLEVVNIRPSGNEEGVS